METKDADSNPRVAIATLPTGLEGRPASDGHYETKAPGVDCTKPHPRSAKMKPYNKTTSTIVGLYLAATGEHASISQSNATFVSLLFITLFKSSLLGCVGLCSTQYLWRVLRGQPIALSTVESLFQMRHNPVDLFYRHTILSLSFLLAVYTWIVPFATIYPSGALTISATPFVHTESMQMSAPELVFDPDFDPFVPNNLSRLAIFAGLNHEIYSWNNNQDAPGTINLTTNLQVMRPQGLLVRLSESVIAAGEIALNSSVTLGENSTYMLDFMGPQLSCRNVELFNQTVWGPPAFTDLALGKAERDTRKPKTLMSSYNMDKGYEWQMFQQTMLGGACLDSQEYSHTPDQLLNGTFPKRYLLETSKTNCTDRYVRYTANVTFVKGVRSIHYTMHDIEPQPAKDLVLNMVWEVASDQVPADREQRRGEVMHAAYTASPYFQRSRGFLKERFRYWNAFAIYNAFLAAIESATMRGCDTKDYSQECSMDWTMSNGSRAAFGPVKCYEESSITTSILHISRLNPHRYLTSGERNTGTSDVNVTEAGLNELLTNITLSLMTLNLWTNDVNVTATSYRNTYDFSHKISLTLPYALCLAFGLPIVALGLSSLWSNGVPANDAFMQVMMATRGRTEMERLVLEQGVVDADKVPKELKNLKVRYGELVTEDVVNAKKSFGFGTAVETAWTRKKN
ncbi:hypothetical protein DE146DRAFT_744015 [Phaeosphaeria sp. MPI-PUGE-AT-0046c]|nr:hypothetical protein DE146DRAFT_744015 [Phaeosphaeria sp. MPI-PUGE-AT-0046c]